MRLSIKEKAGIPDVSRIFDGLHLQEKFIENTANQETRKGLESEFIEAGETHFKICKSCRNRLEELERQPKEQNLPHE